MIGSSEHNSDCVLNSLALNRDLRTSTDSVCVCVWCYTRWGRVFEAGNLRLGRNVQLTTLRMKLQPGICPFPVLGFWGKKPCHTPVPWHIAGISRPLPVSRVYGAAVSF